MMENIGLNSEIQAGGKTFHVQTQYLEADKKITANVFEDGRLLTGKSVEVVSETPAPEMKVLLNRLHRETSNEIEMLFYISDKVRTIQHSISNNKLGLVFLKKNLYDEAIREFQSALDIDPGFMEAYSNLGKAYLKKKMLQQAKEIFEQGIKNNSLYPDFHNNLGFTHYLLNDMKDAVQGLLKALEINPEYTDAQLNLCIVYLKSIVDDNFDKSLPPKIERMNNTKELLGKILEKDSIYKPEYITKALERIEENDYQKAHEALELCQADPDLTFDLEIENEFYLNFMFGGKGKDDSYIQNYTDQLTAMIEKYPEFPDLRNSLGIANLIQCRNLFLNALEEFRSALKINPGYKKAAKNLKLAENDGKGFLILLRAILK